VPQKNENDTKYANKSVNEIFNGIIPWRLAISFLDKHRKKVDKD
jgi:hypothetical protein